MNRSYIVTPSVQIWKQSDKNWTIYFLQRDFQGRLLGGWTLVTGVSGENLFLKIRPMYLYGDCVFSDL